MKHYLEMNLKSKSLLKGHASSQCKGYIGCNYAYSNQEETSFMRVYI